MEEEIVSYDTAVMSKERGFNTYTTYWYSVKDRTPTLDGDRMFALEYLQAPTQSLLQRWLREERFLLVYCIPNESVAGMWHYKVEDAWTTNEDLSEHYATYEQALEKGLMEALKIIKL